MIPLRFCVRVDKETDENRKLINPKNENCCWLKNRNICFVLWCGEPTKKDMDVISIP